MRRIVVTALMRALRMRDWILLDPLTVRELHELLKRRDAE